MSDNALTQLKQSLGEKAIAAILGLHTRTIRRYNADPEKTPAHVLLACKYIISLLDNSDYIFLKYNLTRDDLLFTLQSSNTPQMTNDKFTNWMKENNFIFRQVADILGISSRTAQRYACGSTPILKTIYLAIKYTSSQKLPSLFFLNHEN